jgi:hypothetical protein
VSLLRLRGGVAPGGTEWVGSTLSPKLRARNRYGQRAEGIMGQGELT